MSSLCIQLTLASPMSKEDNNIEDDETIVKREFDIEEFEVMVETIELQLEDANGIEAWQKVKKDANPYKLGKR